MDKSIFGSMTYKTKCKEISCCGIKILRQKKK